MVRHDCQESTTEYDVRQICANKAHEVIKQSKIGRPFTRDKNPHRYMRSDERRNERWETSFLDHEDVAALLHSGVNRRSKERGDEIHI